MKLIEEINGNLYYDGTCLKDLAIKYGTPLKVTFLNLIKERVLNLKNTFDKVINDIDYKGKFIYLNANKANYGAKEVFESFKYADGIETSSYYDLLYSLDIFKKHPEYKNKIIYSNGYKEPSYVDAIINANSAGYDITDIIDSLNEYEYLKERKANIKVGLRVHLESQYSEEGDIIENDRFGLNKEEFDYIIDDLSKTNLTLTTIHFHQRGFDYEKDKFTINFKKAFNNYYVKAKKKYNTVINFDMGGGTPLPLSNDFDYFSWASYTLNMLHEIAKENSFEDPNLISENGKYSQKDSTVNIYKVVGKKNTDKYPWYIVDSSMLIALPEMYALGEPITVKPINELDKPMLKVRIGGITCDCDDVYYYKDKGYFEIADSKEDLYIACLGTGSYQNSMNGKGGVHHCLLPEEIDLVINKENNTETHTIRHNLQTIEEIENISGLKEI